MMFFKILSKKETKKPSRTESSKTFLSATEVHPETPLRQHQLDDLGMMPILKLLLSLKFCLYEIQDTIVTHSFTPLIHSAVGFDITLT